MQRLEAKVLVEENMTIQNIDCVLRLKANKWSVSFLYHDEPVCLELCRDYLPKCYLKTVAEWTVEDYLEKRRFDEIYQSIFCIVIFSSTNTFASSLCIDIQSIARFHVSVKDLFRAATPTTQCDSPNH